ncbi:MAG TPA: ATP-binding protein [Candidatus Omnitrophota bacterium]|nr:ATP-binding protein [Candidatus Omnitrophota bacterium]
MAETAKESSVTGQDKPILQIKGWLTPIVVGAYPDETVLTVVKRMQQFGIGSVIVNSIEQKPLGIFTERDVLNKVVAQGLDPNVTLVKEVMTSPIETINASCPPLEIFKLFAERGFRHLPVALDDGRIIGVLSLRSKGFIQEICRIMDILQNVNELKTRFLANVSHELRTPLVSITKSASLILDNYDQISREEITRFLQIIENQGNRLLRIINDLLDITALEAGRLRITKSNVDLCRVIETTIRGCELMTKRKNLKISFQKQTENTIVFADENRIVQVLDNLINNAIKFSPENGEIIVTVSSDEQDQHILRIAVRDNGVGIPKEKLRMIFERFEQAHDPNLGKPEGVGLGLSIVKEIVSLHNGNIWVESEENKGSTFYFTLPKPEAIYG